MKRLASWFLVVALSVFWVAPSLADVKPLAATATAAPSITAPDPNSNPVMAAFIKQGAKAYYLGEVGDHRGWFLTQNNQIQVVYVFPDNKNIFIGAIYDDLGNSVTTQQIQRLYQSNKEVHDYLDSNQQAPNGQPITQSGGFQSGTQSGYQTGAMQGMGQRNPAAGYSSGAPIPSSNTTQMLPSPQSPGEKLMQALQNAAGVAMGAMNAPRLYMIADPNCPHCQAAWRELRPAIFGGQLQIRLVPISAVGDPDSDRVAARFLRSANPLDAWDKYVSGDKSQLTGAADEEALTAVRGNHQLVDAWRISVTPYMVYRGKDGQIKIIQGEPKDFETTLKDIAP